MVISRLRILAVLGSVVLLITFDCFIRVSLQFIFSYDSLTIYDGGSNASTILGVYCGNSVQASHISSSNVMLLHFQTDFTITKSGFEIEYNLKGKLQNCLLKHEATKFT